MYSLIFIGGFILGLFTGLLLVFYDFINKFLVVTKKAVREISAKGEIISTTPAEIEQLNKKEQSEVWYGAENL